MISGHVSNCAVDADTVIDAAVDSAVDIVAADTDCWEK